MKKILTVIFALCIGASVMAQNYDNSFKYSFWSNWSVGVHATAVDNIVNGDISNKGLDPNFGLGITFDKQLSNHWFVRAMVDLPAIIKNDSTVSNIALASIGAKYKPFNKAGLYAFADAGINSKVIKDHYGYFTTDAGLGYQLDFCKHSAINAEVGVMYTHPNNSGVKELNSVARLGYVYRFGATKTDKTLLNERTAILLNKTNSNSNDKNYDTLSVAYHKACDKLKHDDSVYTKQVLVLRDSIVYLNNIIDSLKDVNGEVIDYISAPAVAFTVNSATISNDQKSYVNRIAKLVKDYNDTVYVYGYADSETGSEAYNQKLSEKRAEALKTALANKGCNSKYMITKGMGTNVKYGDSNSALSRKAIVIIPNNK